MLCKTNIVIVIILFVFFTIIISSHQQQHQQCIMNSCVVGPSFSLLFTVQLSSGNSWGYFIASHINCKGPPI